MNQPPSPDPNSSTPPGTAVTPGKPGMHAENQPPGSSPVVEITYPAADPSKAEPQGPAPAAHRKPRFLLTGLAIAIVLALMLAEYSSYVYGYNRGLSAQASSDTVTATALQVPKGATIIAQCAVGRGTQYILPSDIPHGPVYNVWHGKVIGLEYMIGKAELANNVNFFGLPLYDKAYNHIDVGLQSQGHAGFPEPHYHVDVYNVSRAASAAITCK